MAILLLELYWSFFKVGLFTVGGGYAMIPLMEAEVIRVHGWLSAAEFLDIVAVAEMTPGPVSINAATFIGYNMAGTAGALSATLGVISPSLILLLFLSGLLSRVIGNPRAARFVGGLRSALVALILFAAYNLGLTAVVDPATALIAGLVFAAALLLPRLNPLCLIAAGALLGLVFFPR